MLRGGRVVPTHSSARKALSLGLEKKGMPVRGRGRVEMPSASRKGRHPRDEVMVLAARRTMANPGGKLIRGLRRRA